MKIKKSDIALIVGVILVILISFFAFTSNEDKIEKPIKIEGTPGVIDIEYSEYEDMIEDEEAFVVMIVNDGCSYCEAFEPIMTEVADEYQIPVYSINLANLDSNEYQSLSKSNTYLKRNKWGTPTTLVMKGNTVVDALGGYTAKESLISFFEENIVLNNETIVEGE